MLLDELDVRRSAMTYLAEVMAASGGVVTRRQLEAFAYEGEQLKLIDQSRGIRILTDSRTFVSAPARAIRDRRNQLHPLVLPQLSHT